MKERIIVNLRNLALESKEKYDKEEWIEKFIYAVYEQIIEPLQEELKNLDWYKMWHKKFQKEIADLTLELETYRPSKLKGNGQCKCSNCGVICWTDWFSRYKGKILCNDCLKKIIEEEKGNTVVLTGRELADRTGEIWKQAQKQARKETAEKISNKIDRIYGKEPYKTLHYFEICDSVDSIIDELVKEYEVEE